MKRRHALRIGITLVTLTSMTIPATLSVQAASHRDSPLITEDPTVDQNDLYSFVSKDDTGRDVLNVIATYLPNEEPASGPNYYKFSDEALYRINLESAKKDSKGNLMWTGKPDMMFDFTFSTKYLLDSTFLTYGLGKDSKGNLCVGPIMHVGACSQNLQQSYQISWYNKFTGKTINMTQGQTLIVPPNNIGKTTPAYNVNGDGDMPAMQGAQTTSALDTYTKESVYQTAKGGVKVFAGQRMDGFYADLTGAFDGLAVRGPDKAQNALKGFNTQAIAMQLPINGILAPFTKNPIVGVWTTSYRHNVQILPNGNKMVDAKWHQVGRMGNPLFNEVFDPLAEKDFWQRSAPTVDPGNFMDEALNPQPAFLLDAVYPNVFKCTEHNRTDLAGVFIPDELKVDLSTGAVPLQAGDSDTFSRLSVLGGDVIMSKYQNKMVPSGFPNGRRPIDDVIDIGLTVTCGNPGFSTGVIGDSVDSNGQPFNHVFPFLQTPANGRNHQHDGI